MQEGKTGRKERRSTRLVVARPKERRKPFGLVE
jgi:hypothetical protein